MICLRGIGHTTALACLEELWACGKPALSALCATGQLLFSLQDIPLQGPAGFCLITPLLVFKCGHGGAREELPTHGGLPWHRGYLSVASFPWNQVKQRYCETSRWLSQASGWKQTGWQTNLSCGGGDDCWQSTPHWGKGTAFSAALAKDFCPSSTIWSQSRIHTSSWILERVCSSSSLVWTHHTRGSSLLSAWMCV